MQTIELKLKIVRLLKTKARWRSELRELFPNVRYSALREAISELVIERVCCYPHDRNLLVLRHDSV
jgi:hypothetical protein